jgi:predicted transcriptional regulator
MAKGMHILVPPSTRERLEWLASELDMNMTQVIIQAIRQLYQETLRMKVVRRIEEHEE